MRGGEPRSPSVHTRGVEQWGCESEREMERDRGREGEGGSQARREGGREGWMEGGEAHAAVVR